MHHSKLPVLSCVSCVYAIAMIVDTCVSDSLVDAGMTSHEKSNYSLCKFSPFPTKLILHTVEKEEDLHRLCNTVNITHCSVGTYIGTKIPANFPTQHFFVEASITLNQFF